jgi:hypothetical protein
MMMRALNNGVFGLRRRTHKGEGVEIWEESAFRGRTGTLTTHHGGRSTLKEEVPQIMGTLALRITMGMAIAVVRETLSVIPR